MSSPTSTHRPVSRDYDTGFPEFMAARTTSLRHPDAITTPGASISGEDVDPARTLQRSRKSFLHKKYTKRTLSYGRITPEMERKYGNPAMSSIDSAIDMHTVDKMLPQGGESIGRPSKDTDSIGRTDTSSIHEELSPITPISSNFGSKAESPRRRNFFSKIFKD